MKRQDKKQCYWFSEFGRVVNGCKIMVCFQCEKTGKCTFFETREEHEARLKAFQDKHGTTEGF